MPPFIYRTLALGVALWTPLAQAQTINLVTEENAPLNFTDPATKAIVGTATDLVKATFEKAGLAYTLRSLPWQRAYSAALDTADTCVYATTVTEERRALFKWVGPIAQNIWLLAAPTESPISLSSLMEAKKYRIGGYTGDAKTLFLEKQGLTVDVAASDDLNLNKLQNGRIDLWVVSETAASVSAADKDGYFVRNGLKLKTVLKLQTVELALACNKQLDPAIYQRLMSAFEAVRPKP
jgi:polar amino acid transport system substrate-binding protein